MVWYDMIAKSGSKSSLGTVHTREFFGEHISHGSLLYEWF